MRNNVRLNCSQIEVYAQVSQALAEDLHGVQDWTSSLIPSNGRVTATIVAREDCILCGQDWVEAALAIFDKNLAIIWYTDEGSVVKNGMTLCSIEGNARALLTAERTMLNFLQTLSATATITNDYVGVVADLPVKVMDTRKTIPGLRMAQKYAVTVGGGYNQRLGLHDGVLIKENHIAACGGVRQSLTQAQNIVPSYVPIQIEVETLLQLQDALSVWAQLILLDNMSVDLIAQCVAYTAGAAELEVSGNVTLANLRQYALTGVDRISIGGLTKHVRAIDLSLRVNNII